MSQDLRNTTELEKCQHNTVLTYKKGDVKELNYRPISLLSELHKLFMKVTSKYDKRNASV